MKEWLSWLALKMADMVGNTFSFVISMVAVMVWLALGPSMEFSERWMIAFNTGISVVTFLMVFLIQNAQNRNAKALHLKINELIRGVEGPRTHMVDLEQRSDEELEKLDQEFARVAEKAKQNVDHFASKAAEEISEVAEIAAEEIAHVANAAGPATKGHGDRQP